MKGLVFDTENRMQFKDFGEPLLDNLQKEVGGCIEVVHPKYLPEGLCMVIDDEGLLKGYAINSIASVLYGTPEHGQPIVGTAVILREGFVAGELDFMSLDDGDEVGLMLSMASSESSSLLLFSFPSAVLSLTMTVQSARRISLSSIGESVPSALMTHRSQIPLIACIRFSTLSASKFIALTGRSNGAKEYTSVSLSCFSILCNFICNCPWSLPPS